MTKSKMSSFLLIPLLLMMTGSNATASQRGCRAAQLVHLPVDQYGTPYLQLSMGFTSGVAARKVIVVKERVLPPYLGDLSIIETRE